MALPGLPCPILIKSIVGMTHQMSSLMTAGGSLAGCRVEIVHVLSQQPVVKFTQELPGYPDLLSQEMNLKDGIPVLLTSTLLIHS